VERLRARRNGRPQLFLLLLLPPLLLLLLLLLLGRRTSVSRLQLRR
jgi:hypothetical protein